MSTKIYNAYKYHGSLLSLQKQLKKIRTKQLSEFEKMLNKRLLSHFKKTLDIFLIGKMLKALMQKGINIDLNLKSSIVVYIHNSGLYVQTFGVTVDMPSSFKDFHYQNSTDKPDDISDKEWNHREDVWNSIMGDDNAPSDAGFTFRLLDEGNIDFFAFECWRNKRNKTDNVEIKPKKVKP